MKMYERQKVLYVTQIPTLESDWHRTNGISFGLLPCRAFVLTTNTRERVCVCRKAGDGKEY